MLSGALPKVLNDKRKAGLKICLKAVDRFGSIFFKVHNAFDKDPGSFGLGPREEIVAVIAMISSLVFVAVKFRGIIAVAMASIESGLTIPLPVS